jgi:hypothetical protein
LQQYQRHPQTAKELGITVPPPASLTRVEEVIE